VMLSVRDLELYYGDAQALAGVSLEVGKGEIVAIVGANGAGKSSLIRCIAGIEKHSGQVQFNGQDISRLESHQICNLGIGQVAEGRQVFPSLSVLENLQMGAMLPRARASAKAALEEVLRMFPKLEERKQQLAGTLSGGEQQMVAMGRALMSRPKLLLMDEPSMGLAPILVERSFEIIQQVNETGVAMLVVEQNANVSLSIADRGYVLSTGRVVLEGKAKDLLDAWVRHLVLNVLRPESVTLVTRWLLEDKALEFRPLPEPHLALTELLKLYWSGLQRPLHFPPESACAYMKKDRAMDAARKEWISNRNRGEDADPYYRLAFRGVDPLDGEFETLSQTVFGPLLAAMEEGRPA